MQVTVAWEEREKFLMVPGLLSLYTGVKWGLQISVF